MDAGAQRGWRGEAKRYPLDLPDPGSPLNYHMEQKALAPRDPIPFSGSRNRVHDVLNHKRPRTLELVW